MHCDLRTNSNKHNVLPASTTHPAQTSQGWEPSRRHPQRTPDPHRPRPSTTQETKETEATAETDLRSGSHTTTSAVQTRGTSPSSAHSTRRGRKPWIETKPRRAARGRSTIPGKQVTLRNPSTIASTRPTTESLRTPLSITPLSASPTSKHHSAITNTNPPTPHTRTPSHTHRSLPTSTKIRHYHLRPHHPHYHPHPSKSKTKAPTPTYGVILAITGGSNEDHGNKRQRKEYYQRVHHVSAEGPHRNNVWSQVPSPSMQRT